LFLHVHTYQFTWFKPHHDDANTKAVLLAYEFTIAQISCHNSWVDTLTQRSLPNNVRIVRKCRLVSCERRRFLNPSTASFTTLKLSPGLPLASNLLERTAGEKQQASYGEGWKRLDLFTAIIVFWHQMGCFFIPTGRFFNKALDVFKCMAKDLDAKIWSHTFDLKNRSKIGAIAQILRHLLDINSCYSFQPRSS